MMERTWNFIEILTSTNDQLNDNIKIFWTQYSDYFKTEQFFMSYAVISYDIRDKDKNFEFSSHSN